MPQQEDPKPDYYISAEYRGEDGNQNYKKGVNYVLKVWESTEPQGIAVKDLKDVGGDLHYTTVKGFGTDWMHMTQLLNYTP